MSEEKELSATEIKEALDYMGIKFWNEAIAKSSELFPDNKRSAWLFRGRLFQSLFANHFIPVKVDADEVLQKVENERGENG